MPAEYNSSDSITRGQTVDNLQQCSMWWSGPHWLSKHPTSWPTRTQPILTEVPEVRLVKLVLQASAQSVNDYSLNKFSKWNHMFTSQRTCCVSYPTQRKERTKLRTVKQIYSLLMSCKMPGMCGFVTPSTMHSGLI